MSDLTPRDRLAQIIEEHYYDGRSGWISYEDRQEAEERMADAILAAGFRPPARARHLGQRVTDPDAEATYVTLELVSRYGRTVEFEGQTLLDLDPDGHLIGVELIGPVEPKEGE